MDSRCGSVGLARRALANLRAGEVAHASAAPPSAAGRAVAEDDPAVVVHCSTRVRLGSPLLLWLATAKQEHHRRTGGHGGTANQTAHRSPPLSPGRRLLADAGDRG